MTKHVRLKNGLLKIGEIAKESGVLASTVRYYTDMGLIEVADRTPGGQRLYDRNTTLEKIQMIKMNERRRLPLETLKKISQFMSTNIIALAM